MLRIRFFFTGDTFKNNYSPGPAIREASPSPALTREVNLVTESSACSAAEIRESAGALNL